VGGGNLCCNFVANRVTDLANIVIISTNVNSCFKLRVSLFGM